MRYPPPLPSPHNPPNSHSILWITRRYRYSPFLLPTLSIHSWPLPHCCALCSTKPSKRGAFSHKRFWALLLLLLCSKGGGKHGRGRRRGFWEPRDLLRAEAGGQQWRGAPQVLRLQGIALLRRPGFGQGQVGGLLKI